MASFEHHAHAASPHATVFATCLADTLRPALAAQACDALRARGVDATISHRTTCCGQPAFNAGYAADARRAARPTLRALARTSGPIVVPSGSCTAMMAEHWPALFAGTRDAHRAREVASRVVELSQALVATTRLDPAHRSGTGEVLAYHGSCHLERELGARTEARSLLRAAGHEVREPEHAHLCCGFGGTFSVKLPAVSVAMADEKLDTLTATGAGTVVGCDLSCLVHLEARAEARGVAVQFRHLAEQLAAHPDG